MTQQELSQACMRLGDDALVLGQRLAAWCGHGPILEEDIALSNLALDLIGQARHWLKLSGEIEGQGRDEDRLAYFRTDREFQNHLLVERPNGHFGDTLVRQMLFDAFSLERMKFMKHQTVNEEAAGIAAKAYKEVQYHWSHSSQWVIRLGDGTEESHDKVQASLNELWAYTGELFLPDATDNACVKAGLMPDLQTVRDAWFQNVQAVCREAQLDLPETGWMHEGGKQGRHSEHLSYMLAEMQVLPRTYPDATW